MKRKILLSLTGFITLAWTLYTLYQVGWFGGSILSNRDGTFRLMSVQNNEVYSSAIGLTYHGLFGAILVILELLMVGLALVLAFRSQLLLRRAGLIVLCAWALLWLGNSIWMEQLQGWNHPVLSIPTFIATLGVFGFAGLRWKKRQP